MNPKVVFADQLRGVAALVVVIAHYTGSFWYGRAIVPALTGLPAAPDSIASPAVSYWTTIAVLPINFGPLGVALFFLISGFVIPFAFERQTRLQFAVGRFFRIWPTYFFGFLLVVTAVVAGAHFMHSGVPFDLRSVLLHSVAGLREPIGVAPIDGIVWTLEVEIKFYIVAMLIAPLLRSLSMSTYIAPLLVLVLARFGILSQAAPYLIWMFIGTAFHFRYREALSNAETVAIVGGLTTAAWLASAPEIAPVYPSYAAALAIFTLAMICKDRIPQLRPISWLAKISYPLYVVHALAGYALMSVLANCGFGANATTISAFIAAMISASALHALVETPSHKWGRALGKMIASPPRRLNAPSSWLRVSRYK
jgi:peptidoglycan/LPS O-acetylase OafA/YrhL